MDEASARFEQMFLPHLDAAHNLARWLTRNGHDAEDLVQESYLRAFRFFGGFKGGDSRSWLLTIVRNTCYSWLQRNRRQELETVFDEEVHTSDAQVFSPEKPLLANADGRMLQQAMEELPVTFREILVLRELEGLSYKEISDIAGVPIGTVMSSLARARKRLRQNLLKAMKKES
ncbi:MAG: sigma-70 family RNA polymerase sigma factor [Acidobacteriia bacterium]|nr:sigma-70 family RNA polymerase sigma factor [Terriglobia bacterium]